MNIVRTIIVIMLIFPNLVYERWRDLQDIYLEGSYVGCRATMPVAEIEVKYLLSETLRFF